jgi:hypothetical protein
MRAQAEAEHLRKEGFGSQPLLRVLRAKGKHELTNHEKRMLLQFVSGAAHKAIQGT